MDELDQKNPEKNELCIFRRRIYMRVCVALYECKLKTIAVTTRSI